jgi:hypothetical protein
MILLVTMIQIGVEIIYPIECLKFITFVSPYVYHFKNEYFNIYKIEQASPCVFVMSYATFKKSASRLVKLLRSIDHCNVISCSIVS